jgi:hypothetical protein
VIGVWQFFVRKQIITEGVFVKSIITNVESHKGGTIITVEYGINKKMYKVRVNAPLGERNIGKQFFIKLKHSDPEVIVFLKDNPVPECLLDANSPPDGWKKIPECP